jgi:hypothetical protein
MKDPALTLAETIEHSVILTTTTPDTFRVLIVRFEMLDIPFPEIVRVSITTELLYPVILTSLPVIVAE